MIWQSLTQVLQMQQQFSLQQQEHHQRQHHQQVIMYNSHIAAVAMYHCTTRQTTMGNCIACCQLPWIIDNQADHPHGMEQSIAHQEHGASVLLLHHGHVHEGLLGSPSYPTWHTRSHWRVCHPLWHWQTSTTMIGMTQWWVIESLRHWCIDHCRKWLHVTICFMTSTVIDTDFSLLLAAACRSWLLLT